MWRITAAATAGVLLAGAAVAAPGESQVQGQSSIDFLFEGPQPAVSAMAVEAARGAPPPVAAYSAPRPVAPPPAPMTISVDPPVATAPSEAPPATSGPPISWVVQPEGRSSAPGRSGLAPMTVIPGQTQAPPVGRGQVVFFSPAAYGDAPRNITIREGEGGVVKVSGGAYVVVPVTPGVHIYTVEGDPREAHKLLRVEVKDGETRYVEQTLAIGLGKPRPELAASTQLRFQIMKLKLTTPLPTPL